MPKNVPIVGDVIIEPDGSGFTIRIEGDEKQFGGPFALDEAKVIGLDQAKKTIFSLWQKVGSEYALLFDPSEPHDSSYTVTIAGKFDGWTGGTVVSLTSGTKWKQIGPSQRGYQHRYNQIATLRQDTSGRFFIAIDGLGEMEVVRAYEG